MSECPNCGGDLKPLVAGIMQCTSCKKIIKGDTKVKKDEKKDESIKDGAWFHKNASINKKWEICDKGIIISKTPKRMFAVLLCHIPSLPSSKYVRISWFKKSINLHAGMMKVTEKGELNNLIKALTMIDEDFDENFDRIKGKKRKKKINDEKYQKEFDKLFVFEDNKCPKCNTKMKRSKNHKYFNCEICGEVVVMEDGNAIFDIPSELLPIDYSGNYPVNYYLPQIGITFKWLMGEWKAAVIIYAKENPDKRWLRLFWWVRKLQDYISSDYRMDVSATSGLAWTAKKGVSSPNIYDKEEIRHLIDALKKSKEILKW